MACLQAIRERHRDELSMESFSISKIGETVLPFGKYCNHRICDVPLRYLDETISPMPDQWLVRRVKKYVDHVMDICLSMLVVKNDGKIPNKTAEQLLLIDDES